MRLTMVNDDIHPHTAIDSITPQLVTLHSTINTQQQLLTSPYNLQQPTATCNICSHQVTKYSHMKHPTAPYYISNQQKLAVQCD